MPKYTKEFKIKLVLEYLSGQTGGRPAIANKYNISDSTLENWIIKYNSGGFDSLSKNLKNNKYTSEFKLSVIQYRQINNTSLRETAEHFNLSNESMVHRWEKEYQQRGLSGLEDNRGRPRKDMSKADKKSKNRKPIEESEREELIRLREEIKLIVKATKGRYGYRRICRVLRNKGLIVNHKRVLKIMRQEGLLCTKFKTRSRKYSSYKGQVGKVAPNIVNRNFKADSPNKLWLTDVTEFRIKGHDQTLYLSPILDVYNSEIISYTLSHNPTINLTNTMLKKQLKEWKNMII